MRTFGKYVNTASIAYSHKTDTAYLIQTTQCKAHACVDLSIQPTGTRAVWIGPQEQYNKMITCADISVRIFQTTSKALE